MSHRQIDTNNPAADAAQTLAVVGVPFLLAIALGLNTLGQVPIMGISLAGGGHGGEHAPAAGGEAAPEAAAPAAH
jgi:hypothetical protein